MPTKIKNFKKSIVIAGLLAISANALADELMKDFDSLGGNDVLLEQTKALQGQSSTYIVQDRIVSRRHRFEISPEYSNVLGGDAYNQTTQYGININYHINPRWSVGVKSTHMINSLKPEAESLITDTSILGKAYIPDVDYPISQNIALISWYPIYGKMNVLDKGVAHFDLYFLAGSGDIELKSGRTQTTTAGTGLGLWLSQHLTTRFEVRYQTYTAKNYRGEQKMDLTVGSMQMGYLF